MRSRIKSRWILTGLCSLAAMLAGADSAQAGTSITITGGYKPGGGDPPYDFIFDVYLNAPPLNTPGTNTFQSGDYFTIDGLPGVSSTSFHNEPFSPPGVQWVGGATNTVTTPQPPAPAPYASDFTWNFLGTTVYLAATPTSGPVGSSILLGQFTVESSYTGFTTVPFPNGHEVSYTYTYDGGIPGSGTFPIIDLAVPEPTSVVLLAVGAGVLPMFWLRERRRRRRLQALITWHEA